MPDNPSEWFWWIFSTVVVAIAVNLVSPPIGKFLFGRLDKYRRSQAILNENKDKFIDELETRIENNPQVLQLVSHRALVLHTLGNFTRVFAFFAFVLAVTGNFDGTFGRILQGSVLGIAVLASALGRQVDERAWLYDQAIFNFEKRFDLPEPPK